MTAESAGLGEGRMGLQDAGPVGGGFLESGPMLAAYRAGGLERRTPPARVLSISLLALLVAGLASLVFPSSLDQYAGLVWVLALVPVSLLAYYRGWQGAALATVGAMVVYILIQVVVIRLMGREVDWRLFGAVTVVLIAVTFAVGAVIELLHRERRQALRLAHQDPLTGLANRRLLRLEVDRAMSLADRQESRAAMIYVDLGRFKRVNDTYGHRAGDEVLAEVAERVRRSVRACDTVARVGGDEFAVLLLDVRTIGDSHAAARRIGRCFQDAFRVGDADVDLTARLGVAVYPDHARTFDELLSNADHAMYRLEAGSETEVAFFHTSSPIGDLGLEPIGDEDLRRALRTDSLDLALESIHRVKDGTVAGAEVTARWLQEGMQMPRLATSLDADEHPLLAHRLDLWAIRGALRRLAMGERTDGPDGSGWLACNVSASSLEDATFPQQVERLLREQDGDPGRLVLQIGERAVMSDPRGAVEVLDALRSLGLRVAIADFGTGHTSLAYLERFPADLLKVDRVFLVRVGRDPHQERLVAGMIALGQSLDLTVVAEGIERPEQREWLAATSCDLAQGRAFAVPEVDPAA
ncbi:MAG: bifunctional diguanylate cyclase/phosphodiesterase [Candidatus Palauibacterales bacterium]|nr:bifunctional diguanylate cyclase/phosphodiesterase [Candidatus Palauibacterales bacterium]